MIRFRHGNLGLISLKRNWFSGFLFSGAQIQEKDSSVVPKTGLAAVYLLKIPTQNNLIHFVENFKQFYFIRK